MIGSKKPQGRSYRGQRNQRGGGGFNSRYNRFPKNNQRRRYTWSITDLIKSIEFSKKAKPTTIEADVISNTFMDFNLVEPLKENIRNKGFKLPSPIQDQSIPVIMSGKDLIGMANTGTGKTAAFLIPLINKVYKNRFEKVLIIAPTRELAEQIDAEFRLLAANMRIYSALIVGGRGIRSQMMALRRKPDFVIGTPGRITDHIGRKTIDLSIFNNVVLDETDRMVDIGFLKDIKYFIGLLPEKRQSLFFSATISNGVKEILNGFVKDPVTVSVKKQDTNANINQDVVRVKKNQTKLSVLHELLITKGFEKVLIFGNTKWNIQKLTNELVTRGFKADSLHGDKKQGQRRITLEKFKKDEIKILLATDVASRGLDINNVSHIINYELPSSYEEYIHRIGRTGRANKKGVALTFVEEQY